MGERSEIDWVETAESRRETVPQNNNPSQFMIIMTNSSFNDPDHYRLSLETGLKTSLVIELLHQPDGESWHFR